MGTQQSIVVRQLKDLDASGRLHVESFESEPWTHCEIPCDLLTMESWTLVDGNPVASFSVDNEFMIVPSTAELTSWIGKLRRARHYCVFREAPDHIKNSREAVYAAVCGDANVLDFAPEIYQYDRDIVMAAVKREYRIFEGIAEEFRADRDVALLAVRSDGRQLRHCAEALHKDRQLVDVAIKTDSSALLLYPEDCWDVDLVLAAIPKKQDYASLSFMNNKKVKGILGKRDFMMAAVAKDPLVLRFASRALKSDKELVLRAVTLCWQALEHASSELQADLDVCDAALAQTPLALQFAAPKVRDNYNVVLAAVKRDAQALGFASKRLRGDEVVSAAAYATHVQTQRRLVKSC